MANLGKKPKKNCGSNCENGGERGCFHKRQKGQWKWMTSDVVLEPKQSETKIFRRNEVEERGGSNNTATSEK